MGRDRGEQMILVTLIIVFAVVLNSAILEFV